MTKLERDAWAAAYRIYDEITPGLRQAAALADDGEMAGRLFSAALEKITPVYNAFDEGGRLIMLAVYGILEDVYKAAKEHAQERAETPQEGAERLTWDNTPPDEKNRQSA